jgi:hypothetical protein
MILKRPEDAGSPSFWTWPDRDTDENGLEAPIGMAPSSGPKPAWPTWRGCTAW